MKNAVIAHYDCLIEMDNDPARDPEPLREYMDKWDGDAFLNALCLTQNLSVLEIGVGTGRLAKRIAPLCVRFCGIDVSPRSIDRASENLRLLNNVRLICEDFLEWDCTEQFDVICSSLTFMHIREKECAVDKISAMLKSGGRAVISLDKNRQSFIDAGFGRLEIFPDDPQEMLEFFRSAGMKTEEVVETDFAFIIAACK